MSSDPVALAQALIQVPSITPLDHGCQEVLIGPLQAMGFTVHRLRFGVVDNFYARLGTQGRNFCFAGHTDVVTTGPVEQWTVPPFAGAIHEGHLYGRGIADMKGGIACMVAAMTRFLAQHPGFAQQNSLSLLITGDEEGDAVDGTVKVLEWLRQRGERLDYCVVGEPTGRVVLGDMIKVGRRGSLNGRLVVRGVQGHAAYPKLTDNPIHRAVPALQQLAQMALDQGNHAFEPSSFQITNVNSGTGATNVVPGELIALFNIRFNTEHTPDSLETRIRGVLDAAEMDYTLTLTLSGLPFLTQGGELLNAVLRSVTACTGRTCEPSTSGGTSDARFIYLDCAQVLELGLVGRTSHQVDERVLVADLEGLTQIYQRLLLELYPA